MRILTVSNVPIEPHLGSGYVIDGYVRRLRDRGHEVVTLEPRDYERLRGVRVARRLRMLVGYSLGTARVLRSTNCDVVEFWGAESWWIANRLASRRVRPLLIGRSNGLEPHLAQMQASDPGKKAGWLGRWLDRKQQPELAFTRVDGLTLVSSFDRRFALAHHYQPPERLLALENPLPEAWIGQTFEADRPRMVGFFGGWLPRKGEQIVRTALPEWLRARPSWRAQLVGVGGAVSALEFPEDIRARLEIIPFEHDREKLRRLYRNTAILVMPSSYESFGLVAAEAMSSGCAVVASPTGFLADLREEQEYVRVAERSPPAWAAAVGRLMDDETTRRRIAQGGYERCQLLRWDPAVSQLLGFYERLRRERALAG